jgi:hypothetical protein
LWTATGTYTINNDFTVKNTGTGRFQFGIASAGTAGSHNVITVNIAGNLIVDGSTSDASDMVNATSNGSSNNYTDDIINVSGNITVTGNASNVAWTNFALSRGSQGGTGTSVFNLSGNFSMSNATTQNSNVGGAKLVFAKTGIQTLTLTSVTYASSGVTFQIASGATLQLTQNAAVNSITMSGGALSLNGFTLTYSGSTPTLTYNGSSPQTSTDAEFPSSGGPLNLALNNSAGVTIHAVRTVTGMLTLGGNNSYTNLSNVSGYSGITYSATTAQTTGAEFGGSIATLVINNSSGVTLGGSKNVTGTLSMTAGNIALGGNTLTLGTSAAAAGTLAYTAGFMTGSGTFTRWLPTTGLPPVLTAANAAGRFPMGIGANDRTVLLAFSAATITTGGTISVSHADAAGATGVSSFTDGSLTINKQSNMNWTVVQSGLNLGATTINTQITGGGIGGVTALGDITFTKGASVAGGAYALATGSTSVPLMSRTGMILTDIANTFYIGSTTNSPLPVELGTFTGSAHGRSVELLWNTATEINNSGFEVQRAMHSGLSGLMDWQKIGFVDGAGTSNVAHSYSYADVNSAAATYSYRLKQIDHEGKFTYSSAIEVTTTLTADDFKLSQNYPNPFNPSTKFSFAAKNAERTTVKIFNVVGQEVATLFNEVAQPNQIYTLTFDARNLSSGTYFYVLHSASRNEVRKMMLLK